MGVPKRKSGPINTPSRQDYSKLYDNLRTVPFSDWQKVSVEDIAKAVKTPVEDAEALMVAAKIAYQTDKGQFIEYMMMGEVPPVKLKKEEMQMLKGGINWGKVGAIAGIVVGGGLIAFGLSRRGGGSAIGAPLPTPRGFEGGEGVVFKRGEPLRKKR